MTLLDSKRHIETSEDYARGVLLRRYLSNERVPHVLIACDQSDSWSDCEIVKDFHPSLVTYTGGTRREQSDAILQVAADLVVVIPHAEAVIGPAVEDTMGE